jgi:rRNA maturation endonuclease Nob1
MMHKYDGLATDELLAKGYELQLDGRLKLRTSWKGQCDYCKRWFGSVIPWHKACPSCFGNRQRLAVCEVVLKQKSYNAVSRAKKKTRRRKHKPYAARNRELG